jgi:hypothetical protein
MPDPQPQVRLTEIEAPANAPERYCERALPPYRYVPGLHAHPVEHPDGHRYGVQEQPGPLLEPARWRGIEDYLYGVDLYNLGYWWEAHEAWEGLWKQAEPDSAQHHFLQGLIQISAAQLKRHVGQLEGAQRLLGRATGHLEAAFNAGADPTGFMGLNVVQFLDDVHAYMGGRTNRFPALVLDRNRDRLV